MYWRLSPSSVGCYNQCPKKYKFRYIDKIKGGEMPSFVINGSKIHAIIENYFNTFDYNNFDRKKIKEHLKNIDYPSKFKNDLDSFILLLEMIFDNLSDKKNFKPIAVEEKIFDEDLGIVGVIDAVFIDGKNLLVLDFKTGKPKEKLLVDDKFQLATYKHLWEFLYPTQKITHWCHYYTKISPGKTNPLVQEASKKEMNKMYKRLENTKENISLGLFNKTKNQFLCRYCEYKDKCYGEEDE